MRYVIYVRPIAIVHLIAAGTLGGSIRVGPTQAGRDMAEISVETQHEYKTQCGELKARDIEFVEKRPAGPPFQP